MQFQGVVEGIVGINVPAKVEVVLEGPNAAVCHRGLGFAACLNYGPVDGVQADSRRLPLNSPLCLIVALNEKLLEVMGDDVTQERAFAHANDMLENAKGGVIENSGGIVHLPGAVEKSTSKSSRP